MSIGLRMIPVLAILIIGVGYLSIHKPLLDERIALQAEQVRLEEQARLDQLAAEALIVDLEHQLEELRPQIPALEAALPRELNDSDTLNLIRENAEKHSVALNSISTTGPDPDGDLLTLAVNINSNGTYADTLSYLRALEESPRPLNISSVTLDANEENQDPTLGSSITVLLHAYHPQPLDPFDDPYYDPTYDEAAEWN